MGSNSSTGDSAIWARTVASLAQADWFTETITNSVLCALQQTGIECTETGKCSKGDVDGGSAEARGGGLGWVGGDRLLHA